MFKFIKLQRINDSCMINTAAFLEIGKGVFNTLLYTGVSFCFSFIIANIIAIYNTSHNNILSKFFKLYVSIFRGTPVVVQLYIMYFAVPQILHVNINGFVAVIITLSLNSGAYLSEIIRGGLQSIDQGQFEAARTLGIPPFLMWKDIILKQMFKIAFPNICNEFVNLLKETAVVSMIAETDILRRAYNIGTQTYSYTEPLLIAGFYYYILIAGLTSIAKYFEKRIRYDLHWTFIQKIQ